MTLIRWSTILAALALTLALAGCGGSDDEDEPEPRAGTGTVETDTQARTTPDRARRSRRGCVPAVLDGAPKRPTESLPTTASGELGGQKVRVEVLRVATERSLLVRFGRRREFKAPRGATLVGVSYRLRNRGDKALKPGALLNRQAFVRGDDNEAYLAAEAAGCNVPLSPSWAVGERDDSPHALVEPGKARRTAVVFVVPRDVEAGSLHVPAGDLDLALEER